MNHSQATKRPWTDAERDLLRRRWRRESARDLAARLGRTAGAVRIMAGKLGLALPRTRVDGRYREELARLTAEGYSEQDCARRLGSNRQTVREARRALGLPPQRHSARTRAKAREALAGQLRREDLPHLSAVRDTARRVRAARAGWALPVPVDGAGLAVLDALDARGPSTRAEVAAALGRPGLTGYLLLRLYRAGVLARTKRGAWYVYALAEGVKKKARPEPRPRGPRTPREKTEYRHHGPP